MKDRCKMLEFELLRHGGEPVLCDVLTDFGHTVECEVLTDSG